MTRGSRRARLLTALGVAATLTLGVAGCSTGAAPSSIEVTSTTVILDVRTPEEFVAGHLEGAVNVDVQSADFDARIGELDPDADYVVYCRSGNRSAAAIERMTGLGFTSLVDGGGLDGAAKATGLDVVD